MNILIIGNDFDLAHNLPTKYTDILEFLRIIKITSTWMGDQPSFISKHLNNYNAPNYVKKYVENAFSTRQPNLHKSASNSNCSYKKFMIRRIQRLITGTCSLAYLLRIEKSY